MPSSTSDGVAPVWRLSDQKAGTKSETGASRGVETARHIIAQFRQPETCHLETRMYNVIALARFYQNRLHNL